MAGRAQGLHSLRNSFATTQPNAGVETRIATALLRHSDINITRRPYTHAVLLTQASAIAALPELSPDKLDRERQRATGTYDAGVKSGLSLDRPMDRFLGRHGLHRNDRPLHRIAPNAESDTDPSPRQNAEKQGTSRTSLHHIASPCVTDVSLRPAGLEPATLGLGNRCSIH